MPSMGNLKAIETEYAGHLFRSRQEARWAVFLDTLYVKWEYETEGYELPDGTRYLPDFWLPDRECWLEVKGQMPSPAEAEKARQLAMVCESKVYVFFGNLEVPQSAVRREARESDPAWLFTPDGQQDHAQRWCQCPVCWHVGIAALGKVSNLGCCIAGHELWFCYAENAAPVANAYRAARQARFEHGESGAKRW